MSTKILDKYFKPYRDGSSQKNLMIDDFSLYLELDTIDIFNRYLLSEYFPKGLSNSSKKLEYLAYELTTQESLTRKKTFITLFKKDTLLYVLHDPFELFENGDVNYEKIFNSIELHPIYQSSVVGEHILYKSLTGFSEKRISEYLPIVLKFLAIAGLCPRDFIFNFSKMLGISSPVEDIVNQGKICLSSGKELSNASDFAVGGKDDDKRYFKNFVTGKSNLAQLLISREYLKNGKSFAYLVPTTIMSIRKFIDDSIATRLNQTDIRRGLDVAEYFQPRLKKYIYDNLPNLIGPLGISPISLLKPPIIKQDKVNEVDLSYESSSLVAFVTPLLYEKYMQEESDQYNLGTFLFRSSQIQNLVEELVNPLYTAKREMFAFEDDDENIVVSSISNNDYKDQVKNLT